MKKYIAIILSLVIMILSVVSVSANTGTFIDRFMNESGELGTGISSVGESRDVIQKLLYALGIFEEGKTIAMRSDALYADFTYAANVILGNAASDMDETGRIEYLKSMNILASNTPGRYITLDELIYAAVEITGYGEYARAKNGVFADYYSVARQKKLLYNIIYHEGNATGAEMTQILFNILSTASLEVSSIRDGYAQYNVPDEKTILERRFGIVLKEGVLTASYMTSIYSGEGLDANKVSIDGVEYDSRENMNRYVGQNVLAFVEEEDKKLLVAEPDKNRIIEFTALDLIHYDAGQIHYYDDKKDSEETLRVSSETKIIYNNIYLGNYSEELFDTLAAGNTTFTAIDNNSNKYFDVITVWEYEHFPVLHDVAAGGRITFRYSMQYRGFNYIDTLDVDDTLVLLRTRTLSGSEEDIEPTSIKAGNIVSIASGKNSRGDKFVKILVSTESVSDTIISYDSQEHIIEFRNARYKISEQYLKACGLAGKKERIDVVTPETGGSYRFAFSADGQIADITLSSNDDLAWGFLAASTVSGGVFDAKGIVRILAANGALVYYDLADKVDYYAEEYIDGTRITGAEAVAKLRDINPEDPRYIVRYKLNADGKISKLYMPVDRHTEAPGNLDYPNVIGFSGRGKYYGSMIDTTYSVAPKRARLFCVPAAEDADNDKEYYVTRFAEVKTEYTVEDLKLYGIDKFYDCQVGLWVGNAKTTSEDLPVAVVEKVVFAQNEDGEDVLRVYCYMSGNNMARPDAGAYTPLSFKEDAVSTIENKYPSQIKASDLKFGDIIQVLASNSGDVSDFRVLLRNADADNNFCIRNVDGEIIKGMPGFLQQARITYHGKFKGIRNDMMLVDVGNNGNEQVLPVRFFAYDYTVLVERENKKVSHVTRGDISEDDTIFVLRRYAGAIVVVIIR